MKDLEIARRMHETIRICSETSGANGESAWFYGTAYRRVTLCILIKQTFNELTRRGRG